jgi:molecular chaperone GrpE
MTHEGLLSITRSDVDRLTSRIEALLRQRADLESRARSAAESGRSERDGMFLEMLEVVDLLESIATGLDAAVEGGAAVPARSARSVRAAGGKLLQCLSLRGVELIPDPDGHLDYAIHRVVDTEVRADLPDRTPIRVIRKGYRIESRVLRPTEVISSRTPESGEGPAGPGSLHGRT